MYRPHHPGRRPEATPAFRAAELRPATDDTFSEVTL